MGLCAAFAEMRRTHQLQGYLATKLSGLPYFTAKESLINIDTAFFFLDEHKDFRPSLLHHGL